MAFTLAVVVPPSWEQQFFRGTLPLASCSTLSGVGFRCDSSTNWDLKACVLVALASRVCKLC